MRRYMKVAVIPNLNYKQFIEDFAFLTKKVLELSPEIKVNENLFGISYWQLAYEYEAQITTDMTPFDFFRVAAEFLTSLKGNHLWVTDRLFHAKNQLVASSNPEDKVKLSYINTLAQNDEIEINHQYHKILAQKAVTTSRSYIPLVYHEGDFFNIYPFTVYGTSYLPGTKLQKINNHDVSRILSNRKNTLNLFDFQKKIFYSNLSYRIFNNFYTEIPGMLYLEFESEAVPPQAISIDNEKIIMEKRPRNPVFLFPKTVKFIESTGILYIRIPVMDINDLDFYLQTIEKEAAHNQVTNIVIDVRYNYGGYDALWKKILEKIIPRKINYKRLYAIKDSIQSIKILKEYEKTMDLLNKINPYNEKMYLQKIHNIPSFLENSEFIIWEEDQEINPIKSLLLDVPIYIITHDIYSSTGNFISMTEHFSNMITVGLPSPIAVGGGLEPTCITLPNSKIILSLNYSLDITHSSSYYDTLHRDVDEEVHLSLKDKLAYYSSDIGISEEENMKWLLGNDPFFRKVLELIAQ